MQTAEKLINEIICKINADYRISAEVIRAGAIIQLQYKIKKFSFDLNKMSGADARYPVLLFYILFIYIWLFSY